MARQRMYLYERGYVDYVSNLRAFGRWLRRSCRDIWGWFWEGPGATVFEWLLRVAVVAGAAWLSYLYIQYENQHGRNPFASIGDLMPILGIFFFAAIVLYGWKAAVHVVARASTGASAAGIILVIAVILLAMAFPVAALYLTVLFVLTALSFTIFLPMRAAEEIWLLYRRIARRCPYNDCGGHGLPIHICSCGTQYDDLLPSFYGIFHHTCRHGRTTVKLPTIDLLGRNKLPRLCRVCKRPLVVSEFGELSEQPIAIVGGPSVGKTVFLRQATHELRQRLNALPGASVKITEGQERILAQDLALLNRGQVVAKTSGDVMEAFGLAVRVPRAKLRALLYLYDAPGEDFLSIRRFGRMQVIQYLTGIVLIADPFSLPAVADYARQLKQQVSPSETPFHDVVSVLIGGVNQMLVRQPTDKCRVPLAVVISKMDAITADILPDVAHWKVGEEPPAAVRNARYRAVLDKLGAGASIRALELKFVEVQYFGCTALGRSPDLRNIARFEPVGVIEPILALSRIDLNMLTASAGRILSRSGT